MNVTEALTTRISTRAFLDKDVSEAQIRELLHLARWAPSGGNLQPWRVHVLTGAARDRLVATVKKAISDNPFADESELAIYPPKLGEPWRTRRYEVGEALYEKLGIPREDKPARIGQLLRNYEFFGAPVGLFFSLNRQFDKGPRPRRRSNYDLRAFARGGLIWACSCRASRSRLWKRVSQPACRRPGRRAQRPFRRFWG
jgi:nitroreductase